MADLHGPVVRRCCFHMSAPTYTWQQIEQALCELRLETWSLATCRGLNDRDGQLTTRSVVSVELDRKLKQLFPQTNPEGPSQ